MLCFSGGGEISYRCHNDVSKDKIDLRVMPTYGYRQVIPEKLEISTSDKKVILFIVARETWHGVKSDHNWPWNHTHCSSVTMLVFSCMVNFLH